jgi:hypothetical protein
MLNEDIIFLIILFLAIVIIFYMLLIENKKINKILNKMNINTIFNSINENFNLIPILIVENNEEKINYINKNASFLLKNIETSKILEKKYVLYKSLILKEFEELYNKILLENKLNERQKTLVEKKLQILIKNLIVKKPDSYFSLLISGQKFNSELVEKIITEEVLKSSVLFKEIFNLNNNFWNKKVEIHNQKNYFKRYVKTKTLFDKINFINLIKDIIIENHTYFENLFKKMEVNENLYKQYKEEYSELIKYAGIKLKNNIILENEKIIEIEKKFFKENIINSNYELDSIRIDLFYSSPAGRNTYKKSDKFSITQFRDIHKNILNEIKEKNSRDAIIREERSKLNNNLRYDILKRDSFRCQICGSSQSDGVKLHVDHLFPVSKGGKTEANNLRTLCDRCNLGKSDKIED